MSLSGTSEEYVLGKIREVYEAGQISQQEFEDRIDAALRGAFTGWLWDPSDYWRTIVRYGIGVRR